jgi:protein-tyrosine phosphatase
MGLILLVCSGNVCRSPMAAGLLRQNLLDRNLAAGYRVASAGTWALDGQPASANAIAAMAERGIDITDHVAHTLTAEDVSAADLILGMSQEHVEVIRITWPQYRWKAHRLSEMSGKRRDIQDPYGKPLKEYRACAEVISSYLAQGLGRILELA